MNSIRFKQNSDSYQIRFDNKIEDYQTPNEQVQKQFQELIDASKQQNNLDKQQLQNTISSIQIYKNKFIISLDQIVKAFSDRIQIIGSFTQSIEKLGDELYKTISLKELKDECEQFQQKNYQVRNDLKLQLLEFKKQYFDIEQLFDQNFQYELIKGHTIKANGACPALAFNTKYGSLIEASGELIKVYKISNGVIRDHHQTQTQHKNRITCAYQMNNAPQFITASEDSTIIVWNITNVFLATYVVSSKLTDHKKLVSYFLLNSKENLLISGSFDATIKFWVFNNNKNCFTKDWSCQQSIDTRMCIYNFSLNDQENKLICCGDNDKVKIIELQNDKK